MFKGIRQYERTSEKKISTKQMIFLLVTTVLSTADVFLPSFVALAAKQDSWISVVISFVTSSIVFVFYYKLAILFKEEMLFSYVDKITGKFIGKIITFLYLLYILRIVSLVIRELIEIMINAFMPHTPPMVFYVVLIISVMYTVSKGFLAIVKLNELIFPFGMLLLAFVITLDLQKVDIANFLPILENGIKPPIIGSILITSYMLETVIILLIFPHISEKEKALKGGIISLGILALSMMLGVLAIGIFGAKTASNFQFTALEMVRNIKISDYIQRFDSLVMAMWLMGIYLKIVIFTYIFAKGVAETIKAPDYRFVLLPLATLLIPLAENVSESLDGLYTYIQRFFPLEAFLFEVFFPIVLYITAKIRKIK
ncbi:GerAB/ArcD/ProY family transporter [Thermoanaerobacter uzonensis]|uniref:GerAB/ArcD/ProY family transporter n=1 Tax=Thermoanaerobacter uzonensis TaxID=447593 RepID=UPI003D767D78